MYTLSCAWACRVLALGLDTLQRCLAWEKMPSQAERPFLGALLSSMMPEGKRCPDAAAWDETMVRLLAVATGLVAYAVLMLKGTGDRHLG